MSEHTPTHVEQYNARGNDSRYGLHFDDPRFEVGGEAQGLYEKDVVNDAPYRGASGRSTVSSVTKAVSADLDDLAAWLRQQSWSDFAQSLADQYDRKGDLSPKQVSAAKSMRAKVEANRAAKAEQAKASDTGLDISSLEAGRYAVPGGDTRLKVLVSRPGENSKWNGFIFVSDAAEYGSRTNYGRQAPGQSYSGQIQDQLRKIMADPREAMAEYGRLTGTCGMCNRRLEDEESVRLGLGPICRAK